MKRTSPSLRKDELTEEELLHQQELSILANATKRHSNLICPLFPLEVWRNSVFHNFTESDLHVLRFVSKSIHQAVHNFATKIDGDIYTKCKIVESSITSPMDQTFIQNMEPNYGPIVLDFDISTSSCWIFELCTTAIHSGSLSLLKWATELGDIDTCCYSNHRKISSKHALEFLNLAALSGKSELLGYIIGKYHCNENVIQFYYNLATHKQMSDIPDVFLWIFKSAQAGEWSQMTPLHEWDLKYLRSYPNSFKSVLAFLQQFKDKAIERKISERWIQKFLNRRQL
jgi:hypothetical protein